MMGAMGAIPAARSVPRIVVLLLLLLLKKDDNCATPPLLPGTPLLATIPPVSVRGEEGENCAAEAEQDCCPVLCW